MKEMKDIGVTCIKVNNNEELNIVFHYYNKTLPYFYDKRKKYINNEFNIICASEAYNFGKGVVISYNEWLTLVDRNKEEKKEIIDVFYPEVESITLPIEDYNRLRKLEIKNEIKRLKKELKGL